jgi:diphosphomevalonate decarboxylase
MERTRTTSPFYPAWLARAPADLRDAREAVETRDLARLGRVAEASCFAMHGAMLGSSPPLLYWTGATVEAVRRVRSLRHDGVPGFVTIDAGPHVKVLCAGSDAGTFARELARVPGVESVLVERPGPGAEVVE